MRLPAPLDGGAVDGRPPLPRMRRPLRGGGVVIVLLALILVVLLVMAYAIVELSTIVHKLERQLYRFFGHEWDG